MRNNVIHSFTAVDIQYNRTQQKSSSARITMKQPKNFILSSTVTVSLPLYNFLVIIVNFELADYVTA